MSEKSALTEALAAVQQHLPTVGKSETATVRSDKGNYSYSYADLAAVSEAILPLLAKHGLAWVCRPTIRDGSFVLAYELRHEGGESITGEYPLTGGTPQQIGSAITYARRYCLCSVTGVAPKSDDDDAQAASVRQHPAAPVGEYRPDPTARRTATEIRDRALAATTRDELEVLKREAGAARLLATPLENETGDEESLGSLIRRRIEAAS